MAASLSELETKMVEHIDTHEASARKLLEKVVNINSGTMNFVGVKQVGDIFAQEFASLGFKTKWIEGKPFNRAGHLVAEYGDKGPKLLLIGHLDTVFTQDSPLQKYESVANDKVKGPGVTDMKGGDVIIIYALKALKSVGLLDKLNIRIVLTGDEEKRGKPLNIATKALIDAGRWADVAIGFEDGDGDPKTAVVSRRGASGWLLEVQGNAAHSSQVFQPEVGYGAIYEAARILTQFQQQLSAEENLTFNPGIILGGTQVNFDSAKSQGEAAGKNNVVAKVTKISGDLRAQSLSQLTRARQIMQKIVKQNLNKTSAVITFSDGYPPMGSSTGNLKLLSIYSAVSEDLGFGKVVAVNPRKAGAADISFVAADVDMALDGIGLMGWYGHTVNELADMKTLSRQTKRAAILMSRLIKEYP